MRLVRRERRTLIVVDDVTKVITSAVVGFAHAHGIVREVDIAVVAWVGISYCASRLWL